MTILADFEIAALCQGERPMITPFVPNQVRSRSGGLIDPPVNIEVVESPFSLELISYRAPEEKIISYGLSSYGYDLRSSRKFKIFTNINNTVVDPKNFDEKSFVEVETDVCIIPPNSFMLTHSEDYFQMPTDVVGVVTGKSTLARAGIICIATPLEPGWSGWLTLEFCNTTPLPVKFYAGEGCCQVMFHRGQQCHTHYASRSGKYMAQGYESVLPRV